MPDIADDSYASAIQQFATDLQAIISAMGEAELYTILGLAFAAVGAAALAVGRFLTYATCDTAFSAASALILMSLRSKGSRAEYTTADSDYSTLLKVFASVTSALAAVTSITDVSRSKYPMRPIGLAALALQMYLISGEGTEVRDKARSLLRLAVRGSRGELDVLADDVKRESARK